MELAEPIEDINEKLTLEYGKYNDKPNFRVVWSDDQFEKRWISYTDEGFQLLHPEVREVPKYRSYIQARFILERFVPIDDKETDLTVRAGYEPAWTFNHALTGEYIPPRYDMCSIIIESLLMKSGRKTGFAKYKDPDIDPEHRKRMIDNMMAELFGNETDTCDALTYREGVVNPAGKEHFSEQNNSTAASVEKVN